MNYLRTYFDWFYIPRITITDVIEIIMNFNVIRVDKPARILFRVIVRVLDLNQAAVGNSEQVVVFGVNEADTLLRTLQMAV